MPIPPTKLSFNYLLDPKGMSYGRYDIFLSFLHPSNFLLYFPIFFVSLSLSLFYSLSVYLSYSFSIHRFSLYEYLQCLYSLYFHTSVINFVFMLSNLNFLFTAAYRRGYDVLYDEQTDGLAVRRANPLHLPGVANIPFDPNDHPVARDTTPWWQVIVDFYKGDSEE